MALGLVSNIIGVTFMTTVTQHHRLAAETGIEKKIVRKDMKRGRNIAIVALAILVIGLALAAIPPFATNQTGTAQANDLQSATNDAGGVSFVITPQGYSPTKQVVFEVVIDTHQGSLDYDFTKIATLETSSGGKYTPLNWDGPAGGHHLEGTLTFPRVGQTNLLRLTIQDVYNVPERVFEWNLV